MSRKIFRDNWRGWDASVCKGEFPLPRSSTCGMLVWLPVCNCTACRRWGRGLGGPSHACTGWELLPTATYDGRGTLGLCWEP